MIKIILRCHGYILENVYFLKILITYPDYIMRQLQTFASAPLVFPISICNIKVEHGNIIQS